LKEKAVYHMQTIESVLAQGRFVLDESEYRVLRLPARAIIAAAGVIAEIGDPFTVLIADAHEVTLVIEQEAYEEYQSRLIGHTAEAGSYRLITLDLPLESTLTGLMAHLARALADAGVPIFPYAAFSRDHILVPAEKADTALKALNALKSL
jgi:hypothetical protein